MPSMKIAMSAEQVRSIASRACNGETVEVVEYQLEAYSKDRVGFLGSHKKLSISVRRAASEELKELNFFVKSVPRDSEAQMEFVKQCRVFNQEAEFFVKLMPRLLEAVSVGEVEAWAPECYLANDELVVLEDVRDKGFAMSEAKILTNEQLKSAAKTMARMHAASMVAEKQLGKPLDELYPQACAEHIFTQQIREHGLAIMVSLIVEVAKRENRACKDVRRMINRAFDFVVEAEHRVLCHGDAWPNNVMMDDSQPPKCLLVDYQMTRYASRMFDVAQLICLSSYRDDRDKDEKSVLRAYWEQLCETLSKCQPSIDRPTYDELIEEYYEAKHSALYSCVLYLPTILLSNKVFAEYKDDPAVVYQKFIFRKDNNCILKLMDQDEEYAKRITETVLEFVESGEKIAAKP